MLDKLKTIRQEMLDRLADVNDEKELEALQINALGRSGALTELLRGMGTMEKSARAAFGQEANRVKRELEEAIAARRATLGALAQQMRFVRESIDVTEPGKRPVPRGTSGVQRSKCRAFCGLPSVQRVINGSNCISSIQ